MSLTVAQKTKIVKEYQTGEKDTGSSEVQVAILTERISELTVHLKLHPKDFHTRLGLSRLVAKRTSLLSYLRTTKVERYKSLIKRLGLRR